MEKSFIKKGKKSRNELRLPTLHYVVVDDWIKKLGNDAFVAWLQLHSWVDRRDEERDHDRVPYTLEDTWKKLGMGKTKFYEKVIRPLWNFGLIDLVEFGGSKRKAQKPKNIIVYESPMNSHETEIQPLKKVRDYDKDYGSASQLFGRKRIKHTDKTDRSQIRTVESNRSQTRTVTVRKHEPNNVLNNLLINSNNNNKQEQTKDVVVASQTQNSKNQKQGTENDVNASEQHLAIIQEKYKKAFGKRMSKASAKTIRSLLLKHGKKIDDVLRQTVAYFKTKGERPQKPVGALRYEIENGWDVEEVAPQPPKREKRNYDVAMTPTELLMKQRLAEIREEEARNVKEGMK